MYMLTRTRILLGTLAALSIAGTMQCGLLGSHAEDSTDILPPPTPDAVSSVSCAAVPICPPRQVARGCDCVEPAGWMDLSSTPAHSFMIFDLVNLDGRSVWMAGSRGLLLHSVDGGKSFGAIDPRTQDSFSGLSVLRDQHIVLTSSVSRRVTLSSDGGLTFTQSSTGPEGLGKCVLEESEAILCGDAGDHGQVYLYQPMNDRFVPLLQGLDRRGNTQLLIGHKLILAQWSQGGTAPLLLRSTDGGETFVESPSLPATMLSGYLAPDDQTVLIAHSEGVYRSEDGAKSFSSVLTAPGRGMQVSCSRDGLCLLAVGQVDFVGKYMKSYTDLWRSTDRGRTWLAPTGSRINQLPRAVGAGSAQHGIVVAGEVSITEDGGTSTTVVSQQSIELVMGQNSFRTVFLELAIPSPGLGYAVTRMVGSYWPVFAVGQLLNDARQFVAWQSTSGRSIPLAVVDERRLFIGRYDSEIPSYVLDRSADGGKTWLHTQVPAELLELVFSNGERGLLRGSSSLFRTLDAGASIEPVSLPVGFVPSSVAFVGDTALLVGGAGTVLKSADAGKTFVATRNSGGGPLRSVSLGADGKVAWAGGESLLLLSTNGGETWSEQSLPVDVTSVKQVLALSPQEMLVLSPSTLDYSPDRGQTYQRLYWVQDSNTESMITVAVRDRAVYLSTTLGLFRRQLPSPPRS